MSVLTAYEIYLSCLAGRLSPDRLDYVSKEIAHERLKAMTGQDFGHDVARWKSWLSARGLLRAPTPAADQ